jgi:hypothetical protein
MNGIPCGYDAGSDAQAAIGRDGQHHPSAYKITVYLRSSLVNKKTVRFEAHRERTACTTVTGRGAHFEKESKRRKHVQPW